jgi:hypothetical protein
MDCIVSLRCCISTPVEKGNTNILGWGKAWGLQSMMDELVTRNTSEGKEEEDYQTGCPLLKLM